jgi:hypothetical protein
VKRKSPFSGAAPALIALTALQVACSADTLPGDRSLEIRGVRCDWKTEPTVIRTYDVAKAVERIAAVDPEEKSRAGQSLYWTAVLIIKGSTGHYDKLANDRRWEKDHLTLDGDRLTIVAPSKVQDEFARIIRAWEQSGLAQIAVGAQLIFDARDPPSRMFLGMGDRMVVVNDQQAHELIKGTGRSMIYLPKITIFNGQQFTFAFRSPKVPARGRDDVALTDFKLTWRAIESRNLTRTRLEGSLEVTLAGDGTSAIPFNQQAEPIKRPSTVGDADDEGRQNDAHHRLRFKADLPDGEAMLPVRVPTPDGKRCFYLVVTAQRITPPHTHEPAATPPAKRK